MSQPTEPKLLDRDGRFVARALLLSTMATLLAPPWSRGQVEPAADQTAGRASAPASMDEITGPGSRWPYYQSIELPSDAGSIEYYDFLVPASVFDKERREEWHSELSLGDLRLVDADDKEVPYALRVRRPADARESVSSSEFNRAIGTDGSSELTLDLGGAPPEHNEIEVALPEVNYRRRAVIEGSNDGHQWQQLLDTHLMYFQQSGKEFDLRKITYPHSRYRYLRIRVYQDPEVDKEPVRISSVVVYRKVTVPGELVTLSATIGPREPTRGGGTAASAWILDLGVKHMPVDHLAVDVAPSEFSRDFTLEAGGASGSDVPFAFATSGQWTRRAGEPRKPMTADFSEQAAGRLRLVVTDYSNPPLSLDGAQVSAPAREIVFANADGLRGPLRLYYGNPQAEPPHYDIERNLPERFQTPPHRLSLGEPQDNPNFVPEPKPLTERMPWLIYIVLGTASAVLALVLVNLGRTAIAEHDLGVPHV
jgi:hypothetical protein